MIKLLNNLFSVRFYDDGEGSSNVDPDQHAGSVEDTIETYQGSKEANPDGRPLKDFDRSFYNSKEEIDRFIKEAGESVFKPKDVAEKKKPKEKQKLILRIKKKPQEKSKKTGKKKMLMLKRTRTKKKPLKTF